MPIYHEQSRVVGQRIAAVRQRAGLSIKELAERIGWSRDTLVNFELGRRAITIERLQPIATALQVPAASLLLDDVRLATVLARLASEPHLLTHVQFFLDSLEGDMPEGPDDAHTG